MMDSKSLVIGVAANGWCGRASGMCDLPFVYALFLLLSSHATDYVCCIVYLCHIDFPNVTPPATSATLNND